MKAYAIRFCGEFWLVYAATHGKAKAQVFRLALDADPQYHRHFSGLNCRRWPEMDGTPFAEPFCWGYPGSRDPETGVRIEMPAPFAKEAPNA